MEPNVALSVFTSSALAVWFIQKLKTSKYFPWLTAETARASRAASILIAALASAGLGMAWTSSTHTLVISNLTWQVVGLGLWHFAQHFTTQEVVYRATVNNSQLFDKLCETLAAINEIVKPNAAPISKS